MIQNIINTLKKFEAWFNQKFGWFFTNGNKENIYEKKIQN